VVEDYANKMPFTFNGILTKFTVILTPEKLTDEERQALRQQEASTALAVH
jgi:hypothetical protein